MNLQAWRGARPGAAAPDRPAASSAPAAGGRDWALALAGHVAARYAVLYTLVALAMSWPIFLGHVPLPADLITSSPLWGPFGVPFTQRSYGVMEDLVRSFYPGHRLIGEAIRSGEIPLWNPYVLNGFPMHAANAMAIFAPQTMLAYVLPIDLAWTIGFVARPVVAALGTALYARALGLNHAAALSAGFVFGWCGFNVGWSGQAMVDIAIWTPWIMLGVLRVVERPTPARIALTGLAFAMPPLAGHPEVAAYLVLLGAASALLYLGWPPSATAWAGRSRGRLAALGGLLAAAALSLLLAAIQVVPTVEWIPQLTRELLGLSDPMPGFYALGFVVRHLAAAPTNAIGVMIPNGAMYAGLVTLLVLPAALAHPRWRETWFYLLVLAAAVQFAFGWGPLAWLQRAAPIQVDFPKTRVILLADFSLAMLAGFGVAALGARRRLTRPAAAAGILGAVAIGALLLRLPDPGPLINDAADPLAGPRSILQGTPFALALILATAGALGWAALRPGAPRLGVVLGGLVAVDMLTFAYGHMPFSRTDVLLATPPAIEFLQSRVDASSRILATKYTIPYNWEAQFRLATPGGYLYITRPIVEVMLPITGDPNKGIIDLRHDLLLQQRSPLIDFLGVRYIVATVGNGSAEEFAKYPERFPSVYDDGSVRIFENPRALPRARLVPCDGVEVQQFQRRAISRVNSPAFDHGSAVILDEKIPCPVAPAGAGGAPVAQSTEVVAATFNTYAVQGEVAVPSLLVFADTDYVGWRAYVDDREVPILRANHAFKAVRVDPGRHLVRFVFDPWSFRVGAALTGVGLAIVAALLGWSAVGRSRRRAAG